MEPSVTAVLTNAEGWQKTYRLDGGIHLIGTAPDCLIRLTDSDRIAPYHVHIVNNENEAHIRLVNLSTRDMILETGSQELIFAPHTMRDLFGGEIIYLGLYRLQFEICKQYLPKEVALEKNQQVVGLRLVLSSHLLHPGGVVDGTLYLRNLGSEPCQFNVELDGLPSVCYQIEPPPLINPGGEESSRFHITHRYSAPPAGDTPLTIRVSAPTVYPGRELALHQTLKVFPSYRFQAAWDGASPQPEEPVELPVQSTTAPHKAPEPVQSAVPAAAPAEEQALPVEELTPPAEAPLDPQAVPAAVLEPLEAPLPSRGQKRPDLSNVKVVRVSTGDFLDEKGKQS